MNGVFPHSLTRSWNRGRSMSPGAVCLLQPESGTVPTEGDVRLAQVAAAFLGKQMEE